MQCKTTTKRDGQQTTCTSHGTGFRSWTAGEHGRLISRVHFHSGRELETGAAKVRPFSTCYEGPCADLVRIPLMSNRPYCSPPLRVGVWNARSLKTKVSSLCDLLLVVLTISLWLNHGWPRTVVLPLSTSRIHLKTTLFIICQDPHAEEVDLLLLHAKGFMFREIKAVFFLRSNILI